MTEPVALLAPSPETPGLREAAQAYLDAFDMPLTTDPEVHYDTLTAAREALRAALASPPAPAGLDVDHPDCGDRCACYLRGWTVVNDEWEAAR